MKYEIRTSTRFKKDLKRCAKRGLEMKLIYDAINILAATGMLPHRSSLFPQTSAITDVKRKRID